MGRKKEKPEAAPPPPESLLGRMVGAYLAGLALLATYAVGLAAGVDGPTALLRASLTALAFLYAGRFAGSYVGRHLLARPGDAPEGPDSEPVS